MTKQACRDVVRALWTDPDAKTQHSQWRDKTRTPAHPGLLLSRCLRVPVKDDSHPFARDDLFALARSALKSSKPLYQLAFERWHTSAKARGTTVEIHFPQRLVIGLGSESPLETGLRLHHTYGVPFLPGAALKGLAAHYCDQVWRMCDKEFKKTVKDSGTDPRQGEHYRILFGANEDAGHIVFHDAWILPDSLEKADEGLVADVMTPHHQEYYAGKDNAPADWDSPTPIGFLSVRGKFLLAVECDGEGEQKRKWEHLALTLLKEALTHWGIGGKTSAGYGRICSGQQPHGTDAAEETWRDARLTWNKGSRTLEAFNGQAKAFVKLPQGDNTMLANLADALRARLLTRGEIRASVTVERIGNSSKILKVT